MRLCCRRGSVGDHQRLARARLRKNRVPALWTGPHVRRPDGDEVLHLPWLRQSGQTVRIGQRPRSEEMDCADAPPPAGGTGTAAIAARAWSDSGDQPSAGLHDSTCHKSLFHRHGCCWFLAGDRLFYQLAFFAEVRIAQIACADSGGGFGVQACTSPSAYAAACNSLLTKRLRFSYGTSARQLGICMVASSGESTVSRRQCANCYPETCATQSSRLPRSSSLPVDTSATPCRRWLIFPAPSRIWLPCSAAAP